MRRTSYASVNHFRAVCRVLVDVLREVFDEAPYHRFLSRNRMTSSCKAYGEFRREYELAKARRPRCC